MVETGRVTDWEASKLRAASEPDAFDSVMRGIRLRHVEAKLLAAVEDGRITQVDADANLASLRSGADLTEIRRVVRPSSSHPAASLSATAAALLATGHGPGRNPWWVNVILVVVVLGGIGNWRLRTVRSKRSRVDGSDRPGRS